MPTPLRSINRLSAEAWPELAQALSLPAWGELTVPQLAAVEEAIFKAYLAGAADVRRELSARQPAGGA